MTAATAAPARAARAVAGDPTLAGTLALTGVTVAAAVGMGRLFTDASHVGPFVVAALVAHGVSWAGRRVGAPLWASALAAVAGLVLVAAWLVLPETTTLGIPWTATWRAAGSELSLALDQFATVVAPTPATRGFLLAGMAGVGLTGILADWGAFRVPALFEAAIPSFTLFVFTATLGASRHRSAAVALYLGVLLLFLLVHHAELQAASASWFASRSGTGLARRLRAGVALGAVAVVAALLVGPHLPGTDEPPVLAWRGSDQMRGTRGRTTVSPLVDIRGRLVDQSAVEVFTVRAQERAYWRLTSLDRFDGDIWSSNDTHRPVGGRLPGRSQPPGAGPRVVQEFTIASLSSIWLPAAYEPERLDGVEDVSYNAELGSIITRHDTSDGLRYRVESVLPRPSADQLGRARAEPVGGALDRFQRLPAIPPSVRRLADRVAGSGTPFQRARALQDFFQRGFTYDLGARPGHDGAALESFLFRTKRGYCEQFAGAYAVMARAVGLPTRVAVGFTPGELGQDGRYHVRGLNAHAWPEVHLQGFGWVAFEPTPGRGAPGAQGYTGLAEAQARVDNPSTATTLDPSADAPAPEEPAPGDQPAPEESGATPTTAPPAAEPTRRSPGPEPLVLVVLAAVGATAVLGGIPLAKRHRRDRRRSAATTPGPRVLVAWSEAAEALARAGVPRRPSETLDEYARRAEAAPLPRPVVAALAGLARDTAAASYGRSAVSPEVATRAVGAAAAVEAGLAASASAAQRLRWALDPRPLLRRGEDDPDVGGSRRRSQAA